MKNHAYIRLVLILSLTIALQCFLSNTLVEGSPLVQPSNANYEPEKDVAVNGHEGEAHHHVRDLLDQALDLVKGKEPRNVRADDEEGEKKKGLKTMDYVWIGLGCLVAAIILCCIISYLFCACVKEIICLPFTCLKKVLCCCCD